MSRVGLSRDGKNRILAKLESVNIVTRREVRLPQENQFIFLSRRFPDKLASAVDQT